MEDEAVGQGEDEVGERDLGVDLLAARWGKVGGDIAGVLISICVGVVMTNYSLRFKPVGHLDVMEMGKVELLV